MIINASTIIVTIIIVSAVGFGGLQLIRQFALQIAVENFEANQALDEKEEKSRKKKIALADAAASSAFQKVEPLIQKNGSGSGSRSNSPPAGVEMGNSTSTSTNAGPTSSAEVKEGEKQKLLSSDIV